MKILAINGSYRNRGTIDKAVETLIESLEQDGHEVESINLRETGIEFCTNCRHCAQKPGPNPGFCPIDDDMPDLIAKIEDADRFIFAAPVNFGSATALFKRFLERLICYGYWPSGTPYPKFRRPRPNKKSILITSSAMPGLLARFTTKAMYSLNYASKTVGACATKRIFIGFASEETGTDLSPKLIRRLEKAATALA